MEAMDIEAVVAASVRATLLELTETRKPETQTSDCKPIKFATWCTIWLNKYDIPENSPKTVEENERRLRLHILPYFKDKLLTEIDNDLIDDFHKHVGNEKGYKTQANRCLEQLSVIFKKARLKGYYPKNQILPTADIKAFPEKKRTVTIEEEHMQSLADSISEVKSLRMRSIFWLYLLTGCRAKEIREAQWSWFKKGRACLIIPDLSAKNREENYVALSPEALAIIARQPRSGKYIFAGDKSGKALNASSVTKCWQRTRKRAKLEHICIHSLRHTFATWLLSSGESLYLISKLLNHKDIRSTDRYAHHSDSDKQEAVKKHSKKMTKYIR